MTDDPFTPSVDDIVARDRGHITGGGDAGLALRRRAVRPS